MIDDRLEASGRVSRDRSTVLISTQDIGVRKLLKSTKTRWKDEIRQQTESFMCLLIDANNPRAIFRKESPAPVPYPHSEAENPMRYPTCINNS